MEPKTDLRILKTQKALCDAFVELMDEKIFDNITVNELCDRAMVRRATFYKHFADKYDFFAFFIRQMQEEFIEDLESNKEYEGKPYAWHIHIFAECVDFFEGHERFIKNVLKSNMFSALLDIFSDEIYREIHLDLLECQRKHIVFPAPVEILATFYTGGIVQTLRYWVHNKDTLGKKELIAGVGALLDSVNMETWKKQE